MPNEIKKCEDCDKPMAGGHECFGESGDFGIWVEDPDEIEPESEQEQKRHVTKPKTPQSTVEVVGDESTVPIPAKPAKKKPGPKKKMDGKTATQRWKVKNRARNNLYQKNYMRQYRAKKKQEQETVK